MYCNIIINRPFNQAFTYNAGNLKVKKGHIVQVPFGKTVEIGMVIETQVLKPNYKIKRILKIFDSILLDNTSIKFIQWISEYTLAPIGAVLKLFIINNKIIDFKMSSLDELQTNFKPIKTTKKGIKPL